MVEIEHATLRQIQMIQLEMLTEVDKFITTLRDRLKVLHIHDNDGIRGLHQIPFTFTK